MIRPFLSVLVAGVSSALGISLLTAGGAGHFAAMGSFGGRPADPTPLVLVVVGAVLLAVAALTLALHWLGALVVGGIHAVLGLLALVMPFGSPFTGGVFSPVFQITQMIARADRWLGDGLGIFFFSGTALVVGAFLVAAALGVRSRRLAPPASAGVAAATSSVSALLLFGAVAILVFIGGRFVLDLFRTLEYDGVLAAITVVGGVLAGFGGLLLRWSSTGAVLAGAVTLIAGTVLFFDPARLGPAFPGWYLGGYGLLVAVGATFLGAALGGLVRGSEAVPAPARDL